MNQTVLDHLLAQHAVETQAQPVPVAPDELVHVVGAQEPVRDQPDDRARMLLAAGWLKVESVQTELPEAERAATVTAIQQAARGWQKQSASTASATDREQVRWLVEKTRTHESTQQIAQRVWLAAILYSEGFRGLRFDQDGQILWQDGVAGRIGLAPDAVLDLAWQQPTRQTYAASFRQPDGAIMRGKGRHRWHIYRLTVDPAAGPLFALHERQVQETVALIVASETFATQPQLPRDFYGGDAFQQACIDAQDQRFNHILVLSPQHGILSLDDVVPSERSWDDVMERGFWLWQIMAMQRLGTYLAGMQELTLKLPPAEANWWPWLNPESVYRLTVFGDGFGVRLMIEGLMRARQRAPWSYPQIVMDEPRPGYDAGLLEDDAFVGGDDYDDYEDDEIEALLPDLDEMLTWTNEFVDLVNVIVPTTPTREVWTLAADEALLPIRLLSDTGMDMDDLLDLLTDMKVLFEQPVPFSLITNSDMIVSVLLQITHSLVHDERQPIRQILDAFPESVLSQYVEKALQEPILEDRLCACLTLAEQVQLLSLTIPTDVREQLLVWMQTYMSARLRQRLMSDNGPDGR